MTLKANLEVKTIKRDRMDKSLIRMTLYNNTFRGEKVYIYVSIKNHEYNYINCGRYDTPIILHKRINEI